MQFWKLPGKLWSVAQAPRANSRAPRLGGEGCAGVRRGRGDERSHQPVESAMPAARRNPAVYDAGKSKPHGKEGLALVSFRSE